MQVAFHVGVHGSDENGIRACFEANRSVLAEHKVELSSNAISEPIMNEALRALKGGVASAEMEEVVLDALVETESTERLILSRPSMIGVPRRAFDATGLFAAAGPKMRGLADVLPGCQTEFFLALRNPATMLPELAARSGRAVSADAATDELRWGPTVRKIVEALAGRRLVIWCHEDAAFVLPEAIRLIAGLPLETRLEDDNPVLERLLTKPGRRALAKRLRKEVAPDDIGARRAAVADMLASHHDPAAVTAQIEMPGWDQQTVDRITAAYYSDVAEIAALPGVEFLVP